MIKLVNLSNNSFNIDLKYEYKDITGKTLYIPISKKRIKLPKEVLKEKNLLSYILKRKIGLVINDLLVTTDLKNRIDSLFLQDKKVIEKIKKEEIKKDQNNILFKNKSTKEDKLWHKN